MDAQVKDTVVVERKLGNLLNSQVTFFTKEVPTNVVVGTAERLAILRFKTDKKAGTKRENMAVVVPKHDADDFSGVSGHKFLNDLIADWQDSILAQVADGSLTYDVATNQEKLIAEYYADNRGRSGNKVTKEGIAEWFVEACGAYVTTAALAKNAQMTEETLDRLLKGYAEMFGKLTAYKLDAVIAENQEALMKRILSNVEDDGSEMREYVNGRMKKLAELRASQNALIDAI